MTGLTETMRLARRDESRALCELFASVSMKADLHLTVERDPDYFALYDIEHAAEDQHVSVIERDGRVEGVASALTRPGYVNGEPIATGYLTDLRLSPRIRGQGLVTTHYPQLLRDVQERFGCELLYTAVFDSNSRAIRALVERDPDQPQKPLYRPLRRFSILSLQLAHPRPARRTPYRVTRGTSAAMDEVLALLQADQRGRTLGYVLDQGRFERRLRAWPGFGPESFYLARDRTGALRGVTAVWDAWEVKRYRVLGYHGHMKWVKRLYDPFARLVGARPLPPIGERMRYFYLTHLAVPSEDPEIMAALLDRVYADHRRSGHHFFAVYLEREDPLRPAFRGYVTTPLNATLYTVSMPGNRWAEHDFGPGRPGFEMALA